MPDAAHSSRSLDLILRLFCLAQAMVCLRPFIFKGAIEASYRGGWEAAFASIASSAPPTRWGVYGICVAVVAAGPRKALLVALAVAHLVDVAAAISANSLSSGFAEKGLLVFVSLAAALHVVLDRDEDEVAAARMLGTLRALAAIAFAMVALNKFNSDFLDAANSCAGMLNAELGRRIPFAAPIVPLLDLTPWLSLLMEALLLPLLLFRSRIGVAYVWAFFANVALVGPMSTCLVVMSVALVFLPRSDWANLAWPTRRLAGTVAGAFVVASGFWTLALSQTGQLGIGQFPSRVLFLTIALTGLAVLVPNARKDLISADGDGERSTTPDPSPFRGAPVAVSVMASMVVGLFGLNEAAPHLGLKTKYSLTMWSNLRSDAGRTNSYVFPEWLRLSGNVDRALLRVDQIEAKRPGAAPGSLAPFVAGHRSAAARLKHLEEKYGALRFRVRVAEEELDFEGAGRGTAFARYVARSQPAVDVFDGRIMTLERPQSCLGP